MDAFPFDHKPELWNGLDVDSIYKRYFEEDNTFETFTCAAGQTISCYVENVIISCPIVKDVELMFAKDFDDWYHNEALCHLHHFLL